MTHEERRAVIRRIEEREKQSEKLDQAFDEIVALLSTVSRLTNNVDTLANECVLWRGRVDKLNERINELESEFMRTSRETALARRRRSKEDEETEQE